MTAPALPAAFELVVPHRLPMRLVDTLLSHEGARTVAEAGPREMHLFAEKDGRLHAAALLEMMAQTYAAAIGYQMTLEGKPVRDGYLVAVNEFTAHADAFKTDRLTIETTSTGTVDAFSMADAVVKRGEEVVATGGLRVFSLPPKNPETK